MAVESFGDVYIVIKITHTEIRTKYQLPTIIFVIRIIHT